VIYQLCNGRRVRTTAIESGGRARTGESCEQNKLCHFLDCTLFRLLTDKCTVIDVLEQLRQLIAKYVVYK
jgi:hypothetical protein